MSNANTPTLKADSVAPVRAGHLGIGAPRVPSSIGPYEALIELTKRSGHDYEICHNEFGYFVWDCQVQDAAGEGATREEAIEAALEAV